MFGLTDRNALLAYHQKPKQLVVNSMHKQCTVFAAAAAPKDVYAGGTLEALLGGDYMYIGSIGQNLHADDGSVPRLPCSYLTANCDLKVAHFTSRKACTVKGKKNRSHFARTHSVAKPEQPRAGIISVCFAHRRGKLRMSLIPCRCTFCVWVCSGDQPSILQL